MEPGTLNRHRSWLISAGLVVAILLWLASGQLAGDETPAPDVADSHALVGANGAVGCQDTLGNEIGRGRRGRGLLRVSLPDARADPRLCRRLVGPLRPTAFRGRVP